MFLARLLALPFIMGGPRSYAAWQVVFSVVSLFAAIVWLAAPFAIWKAFGLGWLAFWLLPTGGHLRHGLFAQVRRRRVNPGG